MMHIRATLHEDDARELIALSEMPAAFLETEVIWAPAADAANRANRADGAVAMARYNVTERRYMADGTQAWVQLRLKPVRPSRLDLVLETLSNLPGDGTMWVASILAVLTTVGVATAVMLAATNPFVALGFMANHADAAAGVSVALFLFWQAMRQKHQVLGTAFGFAWAIAGALTWAAINLIWPQAVSAQAAADGYDALGRRMFENRGETLAALAPWLPSAVILIKALGFDTASALIDKNLSGKGK